jgi:hypothetical protein
MTLGRNKTFWVIVFQLVAGTVGASIVGIIGLLVGSAIGGNFGGMIFGLFGIALGCLLGITAVHNCIYGKGCYIAAFGATGIAFAIDFSFYNYHSSLLSMVFMLLIPLSLVTVGINWRSISTLNK